MGKYKYEENECIIIFAADENYMDHAKAAMVNCRREGKWTGEFGLIVPDGTDASDFAQRGVTTQEATSKDPFYQKYYVFSPYFRRWNMAIYLDCDILVQGDLMPLIDEVQEGMVLADRELATLEHCFTFWLREHKEEENQDFGKPLASSQRDYLNHLWSLYGKLYRQYNTAMMLFQPGDMPLDMLGRLTTMHESIKAVNSHVIRGTDQPVINLALYDYLAPVRDRFVSYWDKEVDTTKVVHYCSGYAPWIEKRQGQAAWHNRKLNEDCNQVYQRNLQSWDQEFPIEPGLTPHEIGIKQRDERNRQI